MFLVKSLRWWILGHCNYFSLVADPSQKIINSLLSLNKMFTAAGTKITQLINSINFIYQLHLRAQTWTFCSYVTAVILC